MSTARAAGIPVLDCWVARQARWDVHPGIQGGPKASLRQLSNRYDCVHTSLAPGSFDAEMLTLELALEAQAAGRQGVRGRGKRVAEGRLAGERQLHKQEANAPAKARRLAQARRGQMEDVSSDTTKVQISARVKDQAVSSPSEAAAQCFAASRFRPEGTDAFLSRASSVWPRQGSAARHEMHASFPISEPPHPLAPRVTYVIIAGEYHNGSAGPEWEMTVRGKAAALGWLTRLGDRDSVYIQRVRHAFCTEPPFAKGCDDATASRTRGLTLSGLHAAAQACGKAEWYFVAVGAAALPCLQVHLSLTTIGIPLDPDTLEYSSARACADRKTMLCPNRSSCMLLVAG